MVLIDAVVYTVSTWVVAGKRQGTFVEGSLRRHIPNATVLVTRPRDCPPLTLRCSSLMRWSCYSPCSGVGCGAGETGPFCCWVTPCTRSHLCRASFVS